MKVKDFVQKYIIHNIGIKLISLAIAFILWIVFTNAEDPMQTYMVSCQVEVLHEEEFKEQNRYVQVNGTDDLSSLTLDVYLRARKSVVDVLKTRNVSTYLSVYIDLYEIDSDDPNRLLIHYEITDSSVKADLYTYRNKSYYSIQVEDNVSVEIPVQYEITGTPEDGYMYVTDDPQITVTPKTITLEGPENLVSQVSYAYISVNLNGVSANVSKIGDLVLKDENGETVSDTNGQLTMSSTEASVFVPIYAYKEVHLQPRLTGSVQEGYEYANDIVVDTDTVSIYGQANVISDITSISLPEIDLSTITGDYTVTYQIQTVLDDLYGENEVFLMDGSPTSVTVSLTVEKQEEKVITVDTSSILVTGLDEQQYTYSFSTDTIDITVYGLPELVESFTGENMVVILRLKSSDLSAGAHTVQLDVTGTGDVKVRDVSATIILYSVTSNTSTYSTYSTTTE